MEELDEKASNFSERRKRILAAAVPAERILESGRQAKSIMPESLKPSAVGFCLSDMQT